MAANKFATMLHKNSHKMTVILIYTILEWVLISLLLLNALFSYLISKFASYFGLKPPCLLCSRVDDLFEPPRGLKLFPDILCEDHVAEITLLGYCPSHRTFRGEGRRGVCQDCADDHRCEGEEELKDASCSCCGVPIEPGRGKDDDFVVREPPLEELERRTHVQGKKEDGEKKEEDLLVDFTDADSVAPSQTSETYRRVYAADAYIRMVSHCRECGAMMEHRPGSDEFDDFNSGNGRFSSEDGRQRGGNLVESYLDVDAAVENKVSSEVENKVEDDGDAPEAQPVEVDKVEDDGDAPGAQPVEINKVEDDGDAPEAQLAEVNKVEDDGGDAEGAVQIGDGELKRNQGSEEDEKTDGEISIGSEICEHVQNSLLDSIQSASEEEVKEDIEGSREASLERECSTGEKFIENDDGQASDHSGLNSRSISRAQSADITDEFLGEDDRVDTPRSMDSLHAHKTYAESDGSVASEVDAGETLTIDQLKAELQAAHKALRTAHADLEAERSFSAVSANQALAMITRLQEEKAAMQMDALQYQRMIEEQSEYEQEELNDLIMAKENEKEALEKELEIYRLKVLEYESRERNLKRSSTDGTPGTMDRDDGNGDEEEAHGGVEGNYAPLCNVLSPKSNRHLNDVEKLIDSFEINRLAIVEQLKSLEERISSVKREFKSGETGPKVENKDKGICHPDGNGETHDEMPDTSITDGDGLTEEKKASNGKAHLPIDAYVENGDCPLEGQESDNSEDSDSMPGTVEEELENINMKLQDLVNDLDFIRLCIKYVTNGERCMVLMEDILAQLQSSRTTEVAMGDENNVLIAASA